MKIAIVMGSDSDFPIIEKGLRYLDKFGVEYDLRVISAHRTPKIAEEFSTNAEKNGYEVIIGVAGMAAHLAGVLAANTPIPIIAVPVKSTSLEGLDALLSSVQMPPGVPVATVGINAGANACILAIQMLSIKYPSIRKEFIDYKKAMELAVVEKEKKLLSRLEAKN